MAEHRSLKDRWVAFVAQNEAQFSGIENPQSFESEMNNMMDNFIHSVAKDISRGGFADMEIEDIREEIRSRYAGVFGDRGSFKKCLDRYRKCYAWTKRALSTRIQEDWATTRDHIKNFLYKTITAIALAAVILGTAFIANQLGILIPSIRFGV